MSNVRQEVDRLKQRVEHGSMGFDLAKTLAGCRGRIAHISRPSDSSMSARLEFARLRSAMAACDLWPPAMPSESGLQLVQDAAEPTTDAELLALRSRLEQESGASIAHLAGWAAAWFD